MNQSRAIELDRARIKVDFNEMVGSDLVLLSTEDSKADSNGMTVNLSEGRRVDLYQEDSDEDGNPDYLVATGLVERNSADDWSSHVRWCCRIDKDGIRHLSQLDES